jgi:endogenous inhibitor of DNA gyrase (YacG/DUF329 family)
VTQTKRGYVRCPVCEKQTLWSPENRFRPFCSERCKQIDLGAWANDEYRIPTTAKDGPPDAESA